MPSALAQPEVGRLTTIEVRATDQSQYDTLVKAYTAIYGKPPTSISPKEASFESGTKEVRVVLSEHLNKQNLAIVYWQVKGEKLEELREVYKQFLDTHEYESVAEPAQDGELQNANHQPTCSAILKQVTGRNSGNQFGIVINPPYPRISDPGDGGPGSFYGTGDHGLGGWFVALLVGIALVVGIALGRWLK